MKKESLTLYLAWLFFLLYYCLTYSYPAKKYEFFLPFTHGMPNQAIFYGHFFIEVLSLIASAWLGYYFAKGLYLKSGTLTKMPNWLFILPVALVLFYLLGKLGLLLGKPSLFHLTFILNSFYYLHLSPRLLIFFTALVYHLKQLSLKGEDR